MFYSSVKNSSLNQSGIISCISFANQISDMFALGSFAKSGIMFFSHFVHFSFKAF